MKTTYRLQAIGHEGMYTYGATAETPQLARLAVGNLKSKDRLLGVVRAEWGPASNGDGDVIRNIVLIEAETYIGEWTIGVPGTTSYRAGIPQEAVPA